MASTNSKIRFLATRAATHARANLIAASFSMLFGALVTTVAFYVTSPPTTAAEVRAKIVGLAKTQVQKESRDTIQSVRIEYFASEALDLSVANSVVVFGTAKTSDHSLLRFIGIFQSSAPSLIDKLIGRQGFVEPTFVALIPAWNDDIALLDSVEFKDIDADGNKEILVSLKSNKADSIASGLIVLKKDEQENWRLFGIPSLEKIFQGELDSLSRQSHPDDDNSFIWFERKGGKKNRTPRSLSAFKTFNVNEEELDITHGGEAMQVHMLGNGGHFKLLSHPELGYPQIGVVVPLDDDEGVVEDHHLMVQFFRVEDRVMTVDRAWNQGKPMLSRDTESTDEVDFDDFEKAGVESNTVDGIFFSPTGFGHSVRRTD